MHFHLICCFNRFISVTSRLKSVSIEAADHASTGSKVASAVELCDCPPGYDGTSCEVSTETGKAVSKQWPCVGRK